MSEPLQEGWGAEEDIPFESCRETAGHGAEEPAPLPEPAENEHVSRDAPTPAVDNRPLVILPSGTVTITNCANQLFGFIAPSRTLFVRGGAIVALQPRDDGVLALDIMRPAAARSFFEKHARLVVWRTGANGEPVLKPTTCPQQMADALLQTAEARDLLPYVVGLIGCPIIREVNGRALVSGVGYDPVTRLLVTGGRTPDEVPLSEAVPALLDLLADFDFQSPADKARAMASLISPALKTGGFIMGRVPADVSEADYSQAGKGYRQRVLAAVYNETLSMVTSRAGGVGSVDESFNQQLIGGRPFIQLDNFRGRFDSPHVEAFLTAEGSFSCRVPYRGEVTVPPERYFVMLTSNGVDTTRDMANRSNIIRIRKKPDGFVFRQYPEGDLLEHVRQRQPFYLRCIFAVIRHWHEKGKPRTGETRHDFREWAQIADWISQHVFGLAPPMDGHQAAQEQVSDPALVWLRSVALRIDHAGELDQALTATEILRHCQDADIAIPGLREPEDEDRGKRHVGMIMAKLFRDSGDREVDGYEVTRGERDVPRNDSGAGGSYKSKTYTVRKK